MTCSMELILVALVCVSGMVSSGAWAGAHSLSVPWIAFKMEHGKVYSSRAEEAARFANFLANKKLVELHNANAASNFTLKLNNMADWLPEEIAKLKGFKQEGKVESLSDEDLKRILKTDAPVPEEVDWRKVEGRVTGIKNQGKCGAGWAFATIGLLEGQERPRNLTSLVLLSEQELVDCSTSCKGCESGYMAGGLDDIALKLGGVVGEKDYPYEALEGKCRLDNNKFVFSAKGHKMLPKGDEDTLKRVVASYGPVAVAIQTTFFIHFYSGGVLQDSICESKLDHAVLVVGYGKDPKQGDFWIVKNSWGSEWGEDGYMRMRRGVNQCGIADMPTIADF